MDIVERLRKYECPTNKGCNSLVEYCQCNIMDDSADEIERLREENQRQRERIMLLNSLVQTEHEIIRVAALKDK